ncbi:MAG: transposase [Candidatus Brocadiaceae bacterium]
MYRSKMTQGKNKKNFQVYTAEEFIAAITQHIPEKSFQMIRYYGWYSNKSRGLREKQGNLIPDDQPLDETAEAIKIIDVSEYKPRRIPSKQWRDCIRKIYEVDPLCCPNCGGEMKIISFITDQQVIRQILKHLGLWTPASSRDPPGVSSSPKKCVGQASSPDIMMTSGDACPTPMSCLHSTNRRTVGTVMMNPVSCHTELFGIWFMPFITGDRDSLSIPRQFHTKNRVICSKLPIHR